MARYLVSTNQDTPYAAVIADMDSVLTRMVSLHERAWQQTLDDFLAQWKRERDADQAEFSHADYRLYLDGRPRSQGLAAFLAARHIELPAGDAEDVAGFGTTSALGKYKEERLLGLLEREGVAVYEDALEALSRWRRSGVKLAAISVSSNCREVLRRIPLENYLDIIVGPESTAEGLHSKSDLIAEALRQLDVSPADCILLEDTAAGIRAARQLALDQVIGVNRNHHAAELENAGADGVIRSLSALRFPRRLPSAIDGLDEILGRIQDRPFAVFLDFDGTLTPIVDVPKDAVISPEMVESLKALQGRCTLGVISGRDRQDLEQRVGVKDILYAGSHGLDMAGPGYEKSLQEAEAATAEVDKAELRLREALEGLAGVIIERKRFAVAVHYRKVRSDVGIQQVKRVVDGVLGDTRLRKRRGKQVLELEPAVNWDKGNAIDWLMDTSEIDPDQVAVIYVGDDETDEDAFAALAGRGLGIRVGEAVSTSLAAFHLQDSDELRHLLDELATIGRSRG